MGIECCGKEKEKFVIKKQEKVKDGENFDIDNFEIFSEKAEKSICEIIKDNGYGTGFFCKIKYPNKFNKICCLITNYHVITKDILINKENIKIKLNNKNKIISLNLKRRIWIDEEIGFTCIEILKEDNIIEIINPFEIDGNCYNLNFNNKEYNKRGIVIPSIGKQKLIEFSQGIIEYIEKEKYKKFFFHKCNMKGGPIILIDNLCIIGLNKGYEKNNKKNLGIYFKEILGNINEKNEIERNIISLFYLIILSK